MRNFLNFMGKSLMVLVFSFLTLSVVFTSCSPSDDSEVTQTDLNDLVVVAFKATGDGTNIENFARDKEGTKVLSLDGQPDNVTLVEVKINDVNVDELQSSFNFDGRNVTTKDSIPVGEYSISYRITNGTSTSDPIEPHSFTVFHNEDKTFNNVVAKVLSFNGNGYEDCDSCTEHILDDVPYQYLVNSTYMFQLCFDLVSMTSDNFLNQSGFGTWRIVKLEQVEFTLPYSLITNRNIRYKQKNDKKYLELRANSTPNSNGNYNFDSTKNSCNWSDAPNEEIPAESDGTIFDCTNI